MAENEEDVSVTEVRRWAKENGLDVPARGALKQEIYEAYHNRDTTEESTSDDDEGTAPAGDPVPDDRDDDPAGDNAAVNEQAASDDAVAQVQTTDQPPAEETSVEKAKGSNKSQADVKRYQQAWQSATGFEHDWSESRALRNRVSIQTLENGFIHYQRATGTDEVQARLVERGFLNTSAHGQADEATVQAYARFQDSIGLPGTGIPERTSLEELGFDVLE